MLDLVYLVFLKTYLRETSLENVSGYHLQNVRTFLWQFFNSRPPLLSYNLTFQNIGPIGLSLMVVLSECYLQKIECKAIMEALDYKLAPKSFTRFVDDSHARSQDRSHTDKFLEILNKHDPTIKYTVEFEDHKRSLNFLDIDITNNTTNKTYEFKVHQKDTIIHIYIKPNSGIDSSITKIVLKGFVDRAHTVCQKNILREKYSF